MTVTTGAARRCALLSVASALVCGAGALSARPLLAPQSDGWGVPVDGIQLRLALSDALPNAPPATDVTLPALDLQVRNHGRNALEFLTESIQIWPTIEIDGGWYSAISAGSCCSRPLRLARGQDTPRLPLRFENPLMDAAGHGLWLKAGRHSLRVKASLGDGPTMQQPLTRPPIVLVSNTIAVDVPDVPLDVQRRALVEAVSGGGDRAWSALPKLVDRFPDAVLSAVEAGVRATSTAFVRGMLISFLNSTQGEEVDAYLRSQLAPGIDLSSRAAAVTILFRHGDPSALPAALQAWRDIQPMLATSDPFNGVGDAAGALVTVLAQSAGAGAIAALHQAFRPAPIDLRMAMLSVFLPQLAHSSVSRSGGRFFPLNGEMTVAPAGDATLELERFLLEALDDREQRVGLNGTVPGDVSYHDPRVCDIAALVLSKRWPAKYAFHWSDTVADRDAQIRKMRGGEAA